MQASRSRGLLLASENFLFSHTQCVSNLNPLRLVEVELVVALQLSLDAINGIMQQRAGMGETGETILVGSDYLMRSDSYRDPKNHSVVGSFANPSQGKVYTPATRSVHERNQAGFIEDMTDYVGNKTLIAYTPVQVG